MVFLEGFLNLIRTKCTQKACHDNRVLKVFGITPFESRGAIMKVSWIILENLSCVMLLCLMALLLMELLSVWVERTCEDLGGECEPLHEFRAIVSPSEYSLQLG